jgi:hypothetical protein
MISRTCSSNHFVGLRRFGEIHPVCLPRSPNSGAQRSLIVLKAYSFHQFVLYTMKDWNCSLSLEQNTLNIIPSLTQLARESQKGIDEFMSACLGKNIRKDSINPWQDLKEFEYLRRELLASHDPRALSVFSKRVDGFVFEIKQANIYSPNICVFGDTIRRVLRVLSDNDPCPRKTSFLSTNSFPGETWNFRFNNEPMTVTTFSPLYPISHSRYCFSLANGDSSFVLFQPESSLHFHDTGAGTILSNWPFLEPKSNRDKTRARFMKDGRPYSISNYDGGAFAPCFTLVKPIGFGDAGIEWWVALPENDPRRKMTQSQYATFIKNQRIHEIKA